MIASRAVALGVGLLLCPVAQAGVVDRVAAVVGDDVIAWSEIYDMGADFVGEQCPTHQASCVREAELSVLESIIQRSLMRKELIDLQIDVSPQELDQTLDGIASDNQLADRAALRAEIERAGEQWDAYRDEIREQLRELRFQKWVIEPRIQVTEDEMVDLYRRSTRELSGPEKVRFHAITLTIAPATDELTEPEALADAVGRAGELRAQLVAGEITWDEAIATAHSGAFSGPGGDALPPVKAGDLAPALDHVVFETETDAISQPVVLNGYVFLVKPVERISSEAPPYDEVKPRLEQMVKSTKADAELAQWYVQARRRGAVTVMLDDLGS